MAQGVRHPCPAPIIVSMTTRQQNGGMAPSVLVRIPVAADISTIVHAHKNVIAERGSVWFAIIARKLSATAMSQLRTPGAYLYAVQKSKEGFNAYKGAVLEVADSLPIALHSFVPSYYFGDRMFQVAGAWVRISSLEQVPAAELEGLCVVSTGRAVLTALRGMSPYMIVEPRG
jgi:hypothetical protein